MPVVEGGSFLGIRFGANVDYWLEGNSDRIQAQNGQVYGKAATYGNWVFEIQFLTDNGDNFAEAILKSHNSYNFHRNKSFDFPVPQPINSLKNTTITASDTITLAADITQGTNEFTLNSPGNIGIRFFTIGSEKKPYLLMAPYTGGTAYCSQNFKY